MPPGLVNFACDADDGSPTTVQAQLCSAERVLENETVYRFDDEADAAATEVALTTEHVRSEGARGYARTAKVRPPNMRSLTAAFVAVAARQAAPRR